MASFGGVIGLQSGEIHRRPQLPGQCTLLAVPSPPIAEREWLPRRRHHPIAPTVLHPQDLGRAPMFSVTIPACQLRHQGHSINVSVRRNCGFTEVSQDERTNTSYCISAIAAALRPPAASLHRTDSPRLAQGQKAITNPHLGLYRMGSGVLDEFDNVMLDGIDVGIDKYRWKLAHVIAR